MKLLLDTCVSGLAAAYLADLGHDVTWMGSESPDPGDEAIIERAFREQRVLITIDKDFGELAIVHGRRHAGILRLAGFSSKEQGPRCHLALSRIGPELEGGAIGTLERGRLRVRPP